MPFAHLAPLMCSSASWRRRITFSLYLLLKLKQISLLAGFNFFFNFRFRNVTWPNCKCGSGWKIFKHFLLPCRGDLCIGFPGSKTRLGAMELDFVDLWICAMRMYSLLRERMGRVQRWRGWFLQICRLRTGTGYFGRHGYGNLSCLSYLCFQRLRRA